MYQPWFWTLLSITLLSLLIGIVWNLVKQWKIFATLYSQPWATHPKAGVENIEQFILEKKLKTKVV